MTLKSRHLLGLESLTRAEIEHFLDTAGALKEISSRDIKKVPTLRGKTVINLFFEASTRTRTSFEIAAKRLSADTVNFSASTSSVTKGETLIDTAKNIEAMRPDLVVIRHPASGAPELLTHWLDLPIINAGDGSHEHPTQGLLDLFTVREKKGKIDGLTLTIIGDITHSRVARSDIYGFQKMGARVRVCGPPTLIPPGIESLGVQKFTRLEPALEGADVVMVLRIQLERLATPPFPSLREYSRLFGINLERLRRLKPGSIIMHPGPINRGVEISPEVAYSSSSVILDQVENGVAVRMAVLYLLSGRSAEAQ
jgi:aspartate carbamoyltransferase catalytic subunit